MATTRNYMQDSTQKHFNMAAIACHGLMDGISLDSGIFCDTKLYHSFFRYNISFIDPPLGVFGEIYPSVMIFPSGYNPREISSLQETFR